ncbi:MAG: hypothetical protein WAN81_09100 [Candidatus Binataceae bacterium]
MATTNPDGRFQEAAASAMFVLDVELKDKAERGRPASIASAAPCVADAVMKGRRFFNQAMAPRRSSPLQ